MRYRETTVPEFDRVLAKWDAAQAIEQLRQHTGIRVSRRFVIPNASIDWMEVSKVLGLDAAEREVLRTRASGIPRDKALRSCGSDSERRELQAAWRRFSRRFPEMKTVLTADAETYSAKRYLFGGEK